MSAREILVQLPNGLFCNDEIKVDQNVVKLLKQSKQMLKPGVAC